MGSGKGKSRRSHGLSLRQPSGVPEEASSAVVLADGTREWRNEDGELHRVGGPAVEGHDGSKIWCVDGQRHREDGPAWVWADGRQEWYRRGKLHRDGGPAAVYADGQKQWWQNDECHRVDGPAVEYPDGGRKWFIRGQLHREDGPAVRRAGHKEWWLGGVQVSEGEWKVLVVQKRSGEAKQRLRKMQREMPEKAVF